VEGIAAKSDSGLLTIVEQLLLYAVFYIKRKLKIGVYLIDNE